MWYISAQISLSSSFGSAQFLDYIGICPLPSLGSFQPLCIRTLIQLHFCIFFIVDSDDSNIRSFVVVPQFREALFPFFQSIFFLSFSLDNLYWSSFVPCLLHSAVKPIHWGFLKKFQLFYFSGLKLPFGFRPYLLFSFWDVLIFQLFQACS